MAQVPPRIQPRRHDSYRDEALTGQTLRDPKPAPVTVPHQALTGDQTIDGPMLLAHYQATKDAQDVVDRDWPLGGPELNH